MFFHRTPEARGPFTIGYWTKLLDQVKTPCWRSDSVSSGLRPQALGLIGRIQEFPSLGDELALQAKEHVVSTLVLGTPLESTVHLAVQGHEVVLGDDVQDVDAAAGFKYIGGSVREDARASSPWRSHRPNWRWPIDVGRCQVESSVR